MGLPVLPSWRNKRFQTLAAGLAICVLILIFFVDKDVYLPNGSNVPLKIPSGVDLQTPNNTTASPQRTDAVNSTKVLVVSAFFPLKKSKHSMSAYDAWLKNFLGQITTDVYFFVPKEYESMVRSARGSLPITINTTYTSPFDIHPLRWTKRRYQEMHFKDRERNIHSIELYAIWNGKPYLLDQAVKNHPKGTYQYAFWSDAGSFRDSHPFKQWPDPARVQEVWKEGSESSGTRPEDLVFFPMFYSPNPSMRYWQEEMGPIDNEFSEGVYCVLWLGWH